jgi:hypothetical protein
MFEWMLHLYRTTPEGVGYLSRSHWDFGATPLVGFWSLEPDTLASGAVRLARHGHRSLLVVLAGVAGLAVASGIALGRLLAGSGKTQSV